MVRLEAASPSVFHMLERLIGKKVIVIVDRNFGYEGRLAALSHGPAGIWLVDVYIVVLRSTLVSPIPQVINREKREEVFIHLDSVQRLEALPEGKPHKE